MIRLLLKYILAKISVVFNQNFSGKSKLFRQLIQFDTNPNVINILVGFIYKTICALNIKNDDFGHACVGLL